MVKRSLILMVLAAVLLPLGACKDAPDVDGSLDKPPLAKQGQTPPVVHFPHDLQTDDVALNQFIERALKICGAGDYDGFRQLFATAYSPPRESDFAKIWSDVQSLEIVAIHADRQEPPNYYVHVVVQLKKPDARKRTKRDAVVATLRENGEWRLSPATKELERKVLILDSQPAREVAGETTTRPSDAPRPSPGPGV